MPDTSKTLAAAVAVLLAASIAGTEQNETGRHTPSITAPAETNRGPIGRDTGPSATATGPDTPGR